MFIFFDIIDSFAIGPYAKAYLCDDTVLTGNCDETNSFVQAVGPSIHKDFDMLVALDPAELTLSAFYNNIQSFYTPQALTMFQGSDCIGKTALIELDFGVNS